VARAGYEPAPGLTVVLVALIAVTTPVQPWYAVTVAGVGALAGRPWLVVLGLAAEPYYAAVILAAPHQVAAGRISYGLAFVIVACFRLVDVRRRTQARRVGTSPLLEPAGRLDIMPVAAPR
jgi:hypothetical protein